MCNGLRLGRKGRPGLGRQEMAVENGPVIYAEALLLLGGAVVAAPLFKRLGLGTILGYLAAGIVMGPVARLISGGERLLHVAELGIVLLLFLIGLELKPRRLWAMRREIFGLGLAQLVITGAVLTAIVMGAAGWPFSAAAVAGFGLAMSSTAFVMQTLVEQGARNRGFGQTSFSILLLQDIAIAPMLALVPLLSPGGENVDAIGPGRFAIAIACIAVLLVSSRYLLNPLFALIASTGAREAMIAVALFVVLGAASLAEIAGLSMALGAFIAGVMLAESSFRHELEANIEPFRGILLGLFFIAVGLSLDLGVVLDNWLAILIAVPLLMVVKSSVIYGLCRLFKHPHNDSVRVGTLLSQGGEFGFVLFTAAGAAAILEPELSSLLIAVVTLSMALTPLATRLGNALIAEEAADTIREDFDGAGSDVLMIGFSRFGQIVSQILLSGGLDVTIIDHSARRVRAVEKFGFRIYFGDGRRKDVLEAAGIRHAKLVAVCTHGRETTEAIVDVIRHDFPDVKLYVRAYDRAHAVSLRQRGVDYELRETLDSALVFGRDTLRALGVAEDEADEVTADVRRRDAEKLALQVAGDAKQTETAGFTPEPLQKPKRRAHRIDNVPDTTMESQKH